MSVGTTSNSQSLLDKLNEQQAQAVSLKWGPALVIAGAGSGKTTVLTRRIAWLISELEQDPEAVLAVTFTNKAAGEMKKRVEGLVGHDVGRRLTIGTFHSICARILRREVDQYKTPEGWSWTNNFVIYDESDSSSLVKACITRMNLDEKVFIPKAIRHEISALKNDGKTCTQYATVARTYREQRISEIFSAYQADLARNNAFDFDDLINVFTDLLKQNPTVLARQRRRFRHVLVDEFQDTNKAQFDLVSLLSPPTTDGGDDNAEWQERSLMVVGDVDQSIYSWRKADFRIILGFQNDYKNCALIKLEENYRSTSTILDIANSIITNNTERIDKVLRCNRGKGGKAQCYEAQDEIDESYYVVEELKRLTARGRKLDDAVILYRTNAQSRAIEEILVRNHIPYTVVGSTRFYDRQEIKDILAYLKLIYNGRDSISFNRVINVPRRGIGKTSLERLAAYAEDNDIPLLEAALEADRIRDLPQKAAGALKEFALLARSWQTAAGTLSATQQRQANASGGLSGTAALGALFAHHEATLAENAAQIAAAADTTSGAPGNESENGAASDTKSKGISVSALLQRVLRETRYLDKLTEDSDKDELAEGRIENVKELVAVAEEFDSVADEPDLDSFLTRISLVSDLDALKEGQDNVKLMTVHSAKGLEFDVVFIMGLEEGLFPHIRSLDSPTAMEEERRLMYVAVTRAAECLYLTLARKRMMRTQGNFNTTYTIASQFLKEITPGLLAGYYPSPNNEAAPDASEGAQSGGRGPQGFAERGASNRYGGGSGDRDNGSRRNNDSGNDSGNSRYANRGYDGGGSKYGGGGGYGGSGGYGDRSSSSGARSSGSANQPKPRAMRPGQSGDSFTSSTENIRVRIDGRPPSPPDNSFEHFVVGDVVNHSKFGRGKVVQVIGEQDKELYNIEFEQAGKRLLDPKFAKLDKITS